jgi:Uncharacterized protein conserved in bacteria (DUF2252)
MQALSKLGESVDGGYRIVSQPPIIVPMRELEGMYGISADEFEHAIHQQFRTYRATLQDDRRYLLEKFQVIDMARKVVGVGSVGTRAFIVLFQGRDLNDPLFLQVKEATASVLEDHLPKSRYKQPGERVEKGQGMMQAASDICLGWTKGAQENRYLYWRHLRDMKGSAEVESLRPAGLGFYARQCAWTLARAHARSGDPIAITAYLAKGDAFDKAIVDFPNATPTRTTATTRPSSTRSERAAWKRSKTFDRAPPDHPGEMTSCPSTAFRPGDTVDRVPGVEVTMDSGSNECDYGVQREGGGSLEWSEGIGKWLMQGRDGKQSFLPCTRSTRA